MNWLDYRKKIGIGFSDDEKYKLFLRKMYNFLDGFVINKEVEIHSKEYINFFDTCGLEIDHRICFEPEAGYDRLRHCISVFRSKDYSIESFLAYYIAFLNSLDLKGADEKEKKKFWILLTKKLKQSQIAFDIFEDKDGKYVFPKGAEELDDALVSQPLMWLENYPSTRKAFIKALKEYADLDESNASDVADKFRKALETFFQEFFMTDKSLENCRTIYGEYLERKGLPKELRQNFNSVLQMYTNYMNSYAKHHDKAGENALEYIMYETGNIIRLLINLK